MIFPPLDGTKGFAQNLWDMLTDGGTWAIPRCGLIYVKQAEAKRFVLQYRLPWQEQMPGSPEELRKAQDYDHDGVTAMFKNIGVEVVEELA